MTDKNKKTMYTAFFVLLPLAGFVLSLAMGRFPVFQEGFSGIFNRENNELIYHVFWNIRFPRALAATVVGGMLGISGCVLQGIFRNPLVSPDILGVSSGASFGAAVAVVFFSAGLFYTQLFAFLGGIFAVGIVLFLSKTSRGKHIVLFILCGILVNSLMQAGTTLLKYLADPVSQLSTLEYWLMGSFNSITAQKLYWLLPVGAVGFLLLYRLRWQVNLLSLGDEEAQTLGVNVKKTRGLLIVIVTILVAASVSVCGIIGWVGLVAPHFVRLVLGDNHTQTIPFSFATGAFLLTVADTIARSLFTVEIPISVVTAFIGAPLFGFLIWRAGEKQWS